RLNQAAALSKVMGPKAALSIIEPLAPELETYRWYHTARAAFLFDLKSYGEAKTAYQQALLLRPTEPEKRFLEERIAACEKNF
ncbi:MAG: hypothetical protein ACR2QF_01485, partial [Geminicoccaceae bacterium]